MARLAALASVLLLLLAGAQARHPLRVSRSLAQVADPAPDVLTEEQLACYVKELPAVQGFACKILYITLRRALDLVKNGTMQEETLVEHMQEEHADQYGHPDYVMKPGFDKDLAAAVLDEAKAAAAANAPFDQPPEAFCNLSLSTGFHRVMGAFYPFTVDGDFIEGSIRASPALELKVFDHLASAFNLNREDVTWEQLDELIDTSKGQFALLDALNYLSDQPKSLYRHNVLNLGYIRTKLPSAPGQVPEDQWRLADPDELETCHSDLLLNQTDKLVMGSTWYTIDDTNFFATLLSKYNRTHLAGPSGSSVLLHTLFFDLLGMPETRENQALMLSAIAGDYVPFFHTLTEILMSFSWEMNVPYTLDQDPVEYVKKVAGQYWGSQ